MKNQKGITLIALVITIIVLLILAGVSIAMLTGENGVLTKARESQVQSTEGEKLEAVKLAIAEIIANKLSYTNSTAGATTIDGTISKANIEAIIGRDNPNLDVSGMDITDGSGAVTFYTDVEKTKQYSINTTSGKITLVTANP